MDEELELGTVNEAEPVENVTPVIDPPPAVDYLTYRHQYADNGDLPNMEWEGTEYNTVAAIRLRSGSTTRVKYKNKGDEWNDWETDDYTGGWKIVQYTHQESVVIHNKEDITALRGLLNLIEDQLSREA